MRKRHTPFRPGKYAARRFTIRADAFVHHLSSLQRDLNAIAANTQQTAITLKRFDRD